MEIMMKSKFSDRSGKLGNPSALRWLSCLLSLGVILLAACSGGSTLSESDEVAIYSAVIRQIYTVDDTFSGTLNPPAVHVVRNTDDSVGDPDVEQLASIELSRAVQEEVEAALSDLPTELSWVNAFDDVALDGSTGQVVGAGVIVTLGNVHLQADGRALVSASIYIANLAAGGQTYIVEEVDGSWEVTGNTGVQWIS
jgi:hypothetical protein